MKRHYFAFVSMMFSTGAMAGQFYEYIPYYDNNPFIFCTQGVPEDCWIPIDKTRGIYSVTDPECFNPYSAAMFQRVCPHAFEYMYKPSNASMSRDPADANS